MTGIDLKYICTVIGNLAGVPIRVYKDDQQVFYHALTQLPRDPMVLHREALWQIRTNVGYFVTEDFHYY